jgi:diaminopimelate epimerase
MTSIRFTKMHGAGNDYIYVDATGQSPSDPSALARTMSDRHVGVGGDGLILILPPGPGVEADLRMRMFNADGSEAEMCGNGIRCVCKYAHDHGLATTRPMRVQTGAGVLSLDYTLDARGAVGEVTVDMGVPELEPSRIPVVDHGSAPIVDAPLTPWPPAGGDAWIAEGGVEPRMTCLALGNPHLVLYCADVRAVPLERLGPELERHAIFPSRINVHVVEVESQGEVSMRTWERGAGLTRACGTGASAVCVAGVLNRRTGRHLLTHLPGGDLRIRWDEATSHVFLTGPAVEVFSGSWPVP